MYYCAKSARRPLSAGSHVLAQSPLYLVMLRMTVNERSGNRLVRLEKISQSCVILHYLC